MDYRTLIDVKNKYNETNQESIKNNIRQLMKKNNIKHTTIAELLEISTHTSYSYTNKSNKNKPELYNLLILSSYFNIDILDLFL